MKQMLQMSDMEKTELKKLFDGLDADIKKTKDGKELSETFAELEKQAKSIANVGVGKVAPDFSAPNPEGKTISLKQSLGKVTIVDFWASWCGPCRKENPSVVAMYNELHSKGLNVIGVSLDDDAAKWKEAIAADKLTWNHVSNLKKWDDPIAKQYGIASIPATFILDASGKIVAKDLRGDQLKAKVLELLAK
jgi:peroxiredoxin